MRMHVRRHMGLTPYACSWDCGKRFVSNALRNAHEVKAHIGDEMYIHAGFKFSLCIQDSIVQELRLVKMSDAVFNSF